MFALITTLSTNLLRTYIIYRFMRLFFWTDMEEKKKERACYEGSALLWYMTVIKGELCPGDNRKDTCDNAL